MTAGRGSAPPRAAISTKTTLIVSDRGQTRRALGSSRAARGGMPGELNLSDLCAPEWPGFGSEPPRAGSLAAEPAHCRGPFLDLGLKFTHEVSAQPSGVVRLAVRAALVGQNSDVGVVQVAVRSDQFPVAVVLGRLATLDPIQGSVSRGSSRPRRVVWRWRCVGLRLFALGPRGSKLVESCGVLSLPNFVQKPSGSGGSNFFP